MSVRVEHGDCREILAALGVTVDAVVCDPPYDLVSMTKRFGKPGSAVATSPDHGRFARGFMGQQWDGEGVAFDSGTWRIVGSVLRPGGFLLAFGAPRTHHRLAGAIEDAGFVIQDCLMWLFATGFPKRRDMLKPAFEPIVLAYKPGGKRTLQVDECRIACDDKTQFPVGATSLDGSIKTGLHSKPRGDDAAINGRWPANICHDGSDEVVALFPESASTATIISKPMKRQNNQILGKGLGSIGPENTYTDQGSAARFFFSAKAGTQDRWGSKHPTVKPVELMKWLVALVTPPNGTVLDPFAGSGTTAVAALATGRNAILIEREDAYIADIRERLAFYEGGGTHSVQAKNRNRKVDHGPLFAEPTLTDAELEADSLGSYHVAMTAIGEQVKAGAPVPSFLRSRKDAADG